MQRLIINADDLGLNDQVNKAILHYIEAGKITSSTIMAAGDAFDGAVEIAKQFPSCSFGVHLTIDELKPVTDGKVLEQCGIVQGGRFVKNAYKNVPYDKSIENAIYKEWKSQILRIQESGVNISHLDSHHHCHTYSFFPRIVEKLADEFGIKKVRLNLYSPLMIKLRQKNDALDLAPKGQAEPSRNSTEPRIITKIKRHLERKSTNRFFKRNFNTADYFCSLRYYCANEQLLKGYNTIELMCHPGHPSFTVETQGLDTFDLTGKELISYNNL